MPIIVSGAKNELSNLYFFILLIMLKYKLSVGDKKKRKLDILLLKTEGFITTKFEIYIS